MRLEDLMPLVVVSNGVPKDAVMLISSRYKPIMLCSGQKISDLSIEEQIERGIDWEATAKASFVIKGIGKET